VSPVVQLEKRPRGVQVVAPTPCSEHGLCNLCGQPSALTHRGRIKDSAKAWTLAFDWVRIRVCRECMVGLGNVLHDEVLKRDAAQ
jgi:hypothetical protein